jgi:hypothetical protein
VILTSSAVDPHELTRRTGWEIKPEGACLGDVCVPLPADARRGDGTFDPAVLSERLGMPLLADEAHGLWALGPSPATGRSLTTAVAADVTLPAYPSGDPFRLSSLRGQKVVLMSWASW